MARRRPTITPRGPRLPKVKIEPWLPLLRGSASRPQRMLAKVLERRGVRYKPEVAQAGGRNLPGGQVIDFILIDYDIYLRVQGEYWHGTAGQMAKDNVEKIVLQGKGYRVVDIWVKAIERDPDQAFMQTVGLLV